MSYDDHHQLIGQTLNSMRSLQTVMRKVEQAAIVWDKQLREATNAGYAFFEALQELGGRCTDAAGPVGDLGPAFTLITETQRQLDIMRRDVNRSIGEEIILPLTSRLESDARTTQRMEREYDKYSKQYVEEVRKAEKSLEKWAKKARKLASDGYSTANLSAAQQNVQDRVVDLEQMRRSTLQQVLLEERRRYTTVLNGLVEWMKTEAVCNHQSMEPLQDCVEQVKPLLRPRGVQVRGKRPSMLPPSRPSQGGFRPSLIGARPAVGGLSGNHATAKFSFRASQPEQLDLQPGDLLELDGEPEDNWQFGTNVSTRSSGWFPVNYVSHTGGGSVNGSHTNIPPPDY